MDIKEFCRQRDADFFINFYNKTVRYAPYSVGLDKDKLDRFVLKNVDNRHEFIYVCNQEGEKGIIHFSQNTGNKTEGFVFLLIAEKNPTAKKLLKLAQDKLIQLGVRYIKCYPWHNPYQFILLGTESYCWAGMYPAINAFNSLSYDIDLDIVAMRLNMNKRPEVIYSNNENVTVKEIFTRDDSLVHTGQYVAYVNDIQVGRSGYYYLKAVSEHIGKGVGQVDIWVNDEYHGTNLGKQLMTMAHQKLYDLNARSVILVTSQGFFKAIKFYEGLGYKAESIRGFCYSKEIDDIPDKSGLKAV